MWKNSVLYSSGDFNHTVQPTCWEECLPLCLSLILNPTYNKEPVTVVKAFLPLFYSNRLNVNFWLVNRTYISSVCKPPLPIDCIKQNKFVYTQDGCMCWNESLMMPFSINFKPYIYEMLDCVQQITQEPTPHPEETQEAIEDMVKILCLL
ncbi:helicase/primase [Harp seal herpesvirus]|uniref:Helicase/primase n=1 Tax=phocid gammaherpesvirus 3 TaxID=2560643 RepID=A0A0R5Z6G4_9GAMA|nr:helicase/primase [Harp seal herpesvirus]AJG42965.1 helicase/primase [Harp seal herpesvirus]